ncbi:helix-turn-helix domain-containing protein, partial [Pseudomonadota bacterium]
MVSKKSELSLSDREYIALCRAKNWSFSDIGKLLDRNGSTISREYNRNLNGEGVYLPSVAEGKAKARKSQAGVRPSKCEKHKKTIHHFLHLGWTPE